VAMISAVMVARPYHHVGATNYVVGDSIQVIEDMVVAYVSKASV
jgi:hypothetical protein